MRHAPLAAFAALCLAVWGTVGPAAGQDAARSPAPVRLAGQTALPGYTGDFDHFAVDEPDNQLFIAGEDHGSLEVFDLRTGQHLRTVAGLKAPHSLLYLPDTRELVVIADAGSRVLDARTLAVKRTLTLAAGADSMDFDLRRKRAYVVTGGKDVDMATTALVEIDPYSGKTFGQIDFPTNHTEALAVEQSGDRVFINETAANTLDVIDKKTHAIKARWKITQARQNAPVAYDEKTHRLFVVTRQPGMLIVLNADTGEAVAGFTAPARADQVIWDAGDRRIYVCGGDGHLGVFEQDDADHYRDVGQVQTPPASKTGIFVPDLKRLYLAASPGDSGSVAALVWLDVDPRR
jgi:DNA-binding beta-propeller fold protein YncE